MQDSRYRTCIWCYQPLGGRRQGRFCSLSCESDSYAADRCEYCGEPAQARDHVVPRAFRYMMEGTRELQAMLAVMPNTVPSCHQCNSIAGADVFQSLAEKREHIQARLREKYWKVLYMPKWDDDEIEELDGRLRQSIAAAEAQRRIVATRISWPGNL